MLRGFRSDAEAVRGGSRAIRYKARRALVIFFLSACFFFVLSTKSEPRDNVDSAQTYVYANACFFAKCFFSSIVQEETCLRVAICNWREFSVMEYGTRMYIILELCFRGFKRI